MEATRGLLMVIDGSGIHQQTAVAESFHHWQAVKKYKEDAGGFLLYLIGGTFVHVPKRFLTDDEIQELRARLEDLEP